jgi:hypothetical protein
MERAVALKVRQFAYSFGNRLRRSDSDALYDRLAIPDRPGCSSKPSPPIRRPTPLQKWTRVAGTADHCPRIAAGHDNTVPEAVVGAAHKLCEGSGAVTDLAVFPDRGHSLVFDERWQEIAERAVT